MILKINIKTIDSEEITVRIPVRQTSLYNWMMKKDRRTDIDKIRWELIKKGKVLYEILNITKED